MELLFVYVKYHKFEQYSQMMRHEGVQKHSLFFFFLFLFKFIYLFKTRMKSVNSSDNCLHVLRFQFAFAMFVFCKTYFIHADNPRYLRWLDFREYQKTAINKRVLFSPKTFCSLTKCYKISHITWGKHTYSQVWV